MGNSKSKVRSMLWFHVDPQKWTYLLSQSKKSEGKGQDTVISFQKDETSGKKKSNKKEKNTKPKDVEPTNAAEVEPSDAVRDDPIDAIEVEAETVRETGTTPGRF